MNQFEDLGRHSERPSQHVGVLDARQFADGTCARGDQQAIAGDFFTVGDDAPRALRQTYDPAWAVFNLVTMEKWLQRHM